MALSSHELGPSNGHSMSVVREKMVAHVPLGSLRQGLRSAAELFMILSLLVLLADRHVVGITAQPLDDCPPGMFAVGDEDCEKAPPGSFIPEKGATEATLCPKGTFAPLSGSMECAVSLEFLWRKKGVVTRLRKFVSMLLHLPSNAYTITYEQ